MKRRLRELVMSEVAPDLQELLPPSDITSYAACDASTADLFFSEDAGEMAQARAICFSCPVRQMCLEYYTVIENDGIAGGLTAAERLKARTNSPTYSADDVNTAILIQRDLATLSAPAFSQRHGVTERSYYRYKAGLGGGSMAS